MYLFKMQKVNDYMVMDQHQVVNETITPTTKDNYQEKVLNEIKKKKNWYELYRCIIGLDLCKKCTHKLQHTQ